VFVGTFEHSLDGKGRVVLPAPFRNELAGRGMVTQHQRCLAVWTPAGFDEVANRLRDKVREGLATQNAMRALSANAVQVEPDSQGRILLPLRLREFAQLERDVVVIGAFDRIEIWNAERWQQVSAEADVSLVEAMDDLGL
jgi:MraZ protein